MIPPAQFAFQWMKQKVYTKTIRVPDGGTLIIGGKAYRDRTQRSTASSPIGPPRQPAEPRTIIPEEAPDLVLGHPSN